MGWVDATYYQGSYLLGRAATIPTDEFHYWAKQAENKINWRRVDVSDPPDYLKDCVCAVAERMFIQTKATGADGSTPTKSFSNDGYSESFELGAKSEQDFKADIAATIAEYLANSPLHNTFIFRGVR